MDHHTEESSPIHVNHSASVLLLQCEEFCFPLREPLCFGLLFLLLRPLLLQHVRPRAGRRLRPAHDSHGQSAKLLLDALL